MRGRCFGTVRRKMRALRTFIERSAILSPLRRSPVSAPPCSLQHGLPGELNDNINKKNSEARAECWDWRWARRLARKARQGGARTVAPPGCPGTDSENPRGPPSSDINVVIWFSIAGFVAAARAAVARRYALVAAHAARRVGRHLSQNGCSGMEEVGGGGGGGGGAGKAKKHRTQSLPEPRN